MLAAVGLVHGEPIRFKRTPSGRWVVGKLVKVETEGSITLLDPDGASRSFWPDVVQVKRPGKTGRAVWQVVSVVAATWQQLELFPIAEHPANLSQRRA